MNVAVTFVSNHPILQLVLLCLMADVVFGILRAFKEHVFNSAFGINGLIRKVGMIFCMLFLVVCDSIIPINLIGFLPSEWLKWLGLSQIGLTEFFGVLFILYEVMSILKNMVLIGIPIPQKIKERIAAFLSMMTSELPKDQGKEEK